LILEKQISIYVSLNLLTFKTKIMNSWEERLAESQKKIDGLKKISRRNGIVLILLSIATMTATTIFVFSSFWE